MILFLRQHKILNMSITSHLNVVYENNKYIGQVKEKARGVVVWVMCLDKHYGRTNEPQQFESGDRIWYQQCFKYYSNTYLLQILELCNDGN